MKENGIAVDDLYQVILPEQAKWRRPFDVHYSPEGSQRLAESVAKSIEAELPPAKAAP
jgi:acyl-CoA thioesterase-1